MKNKKLKNIDFLKDFVPRTKIKVIGIGGGGGSIVNELAGKVKNIDFVVANTDLQALKRYNPKTKKFAFGQEITKGLGAGMNINVGKIAAEKEEERIKKTLKGVDLCILVSCLGGGAGSGASPIFAKYAKEMTGIVFGIFTLPFKFEGQKRAKIAQDALKTMMPSLNAISVIPNDKIFRLVAPETSLKKSLSIINKSLANNLQGLIELLYLPGLINIDWADLKAVLEGRGQIVYHNTVEINKKDKTTEAVKKVLSNPLYQYKLKGADRILFNISGGKELEMRKVEAISKSISELNPQAKIIFGVSHHNKYKNKIKITILATGITTNYNFKKGIKRKKKLLSSKSVSDRSASVQKSIITIKKTKKAKKIKKIKKIKKNKDAEKVVVSKEKQSAKPKLSLSTLLNKKKKEKKEKRRNALDLAKESRVLEEKILAEEDKWETPAFLRRQKINK